MGAKRAIAALRRRPFRIRYCDSLILGALCLLTAAAAARTQDSEFLVVRLEAGQSIREIAQKYLGDPDLWSEILRASGMKAVTELRQGVELKLPATAISTANKALIDARGQIHNANLAGAQIFAYENITKAISLHDEALVRRVNSDWPGTRKLATQSYGEATIALEKSNAARDKAAEALLTDRNGNVEGQRPQDLGWRGLQLQSILIEEEKVRTLSDSTAQITFRDASRLRLNANSNAVIQRLRYDPLKRSEEAKVSLIEGDFYALLASPSTRTSFNVEIPRVNASIDSGNFWVRHDDSGAKFTNYDEGAVEVSALGKTVSLGKNEGTVVQPGAAPRDKLAVLPAPELSAPADDFTVFNRAPQLSWHAVSGAVGYWMEIGSDQGFARMVLSRFGLDQPQFTAEALPPGEYFWRVAALDNFGLPGARSEVWRFIVAIDNDPPYLTIRSPDREAILRNPSVRIAGETEPGAKISVDGREVYVAADGSFETGVEARAGRNTVVVVATDPAGNETRRERTFVFMPDQQSTIAFDSGIPSLGPKQFLSSVNVISIGGVTSANAKIEVRLAGGRSLVSSVSDDGGRFRLNLPLPKDQGSYEIAVTAVSGFTSTDTFSVTVDRSAPEIVLDAAPPRLTAVASLELKGRSKPGATLNLNGREIANRNGRFDETIVLNPGENALELTASDAAGNVTVEKWQVRLDREPPVLVRSRIAPAGTGRPVLVVEVEAEDASGLAGIAPFKVTAGGRVLSGHLRFNRAARIYQGTIVVPPETLADAKLSEVELVDDAGNRGVFEIN